MIPRNSSVSSGVSAFILRRNVFTNPRTAASGVRSSWLVIATKSDFISPDPGSALSAVQRAEDLGADPHRDDDLLDRLARRVRRELSGRALRQHRSDDSLSGGERGAARVPDVAVNARGDEPVVLGHEDRERLEPEVRGE